MTILDPSNVLLIMTVVVYATIVWMHLAKKNSAVVSLYAVQSAAISCALITLAVVEQSFILFVIALIVAGLKVFAVPRILAQIIHRHKLIFLVSNYLNLPLTLATIALLTFGVIDSLAQPLHILGKTEDLRVIPLLLAAMAISVFLIINRKGAISQVIGILSLENSITAIAIVAGLEQSPVFQVGILGEIFIWVIIANTFLSMMYQKFRALDTSALQELRE